MVDAFQASGFADPRGPKILSNVPESRISPEYITAPMAAIGKAVGFAGEQVSAAAESLAVPAAKDAGANSVTRDANGNVVLSQRPEFTADDRAFNAAARQGAYAKIQNDIQRGIVDLHQKN